MIFYDMFTTGIGPGVVDQGGWQIRGTGTTTAPHLLRVRISVRARVRGRVRVRVRVRFSKIL